MIVVVHLENYSHEKMASGGVVEGRRGGKRPQANQPYTILPQEKVDYFLVLDFEGVNNKHLGGPDIMEIIEFPVVKVNAGTLQTEAVFHTYVQPTIHPKLNPVCTEITGITQEMVDGQPTLPRVLEMLDKWMRDEKLLDKGVTTCFVTCGNWDLNTCLPVQCKYQKLHYPDYLRRWINIKDAFERITGKSRKRNGMAGMLQELGLKLEGRHHSGIDDSKNIAKILATLAGKEPERLGKGLVNPKLKNI